MATREELLAEADEIYQYMNTPIEDDMAVATERGSMLAVYVNRTGYMLAEAKRIYNGSMRDEIINVVSKVISEKYSAKIQNALVESICKEDKYLVDYVEQLNKTAKYQLNYCITVISKCKEELKYINMGQQR